MVAFHPRLMFNGEGDCVATKLPAMCSAENWEELLPGAGRSVALIRSVGACRRSRADYISALSEARPHKKRDRNRGLGVRSIKPSEGSRSRVRRTRSMEIESILV